MRRNDGIRRCRTTDLSAMNRASERRYHSNSVTMQQQFSDTSVTGGSGRFITISEHKEISPSMSDEDHRTNRISRCHTAGTDPTVQRTNRISRCHTAGSNHLTSAFHTVNFSDATIMGGADRAIGEGEIPQTVVESVSAECSPKAVTNPTIGDCERFNTISDSNDENSADANTTSDHLQLSDGSFSTDFSVLEINEPNMDMKYSTVHGQNVQLRLKPANIASSRQGIDSISSFGESDLEYFIAESPKCINFEEILESGEER